MIILPRKQLGREELQPQPRPRQYPLTEEDARAEAWERLRSWRPIMQPEITRPGNPQLRILPERPRPELMMGPRPRPQWDDWSFDRPERERERARAEETPTALMRQRISELQSWRDPLPTVPRAELTRPDVDTGPAPMTGQGMTAPTVSTPMDLPQVRRPMQGPPVRPANWDEEMRIASMGPRLPDLSDWRSPFTVSDEEMVRQEQQLREVGLGMVRPDPLLAEARALDGSPPAFWQSDILPRLEARTARAQDTTDDWFRWAGNNRGLATAAAKLSNVGDAIFSAGQKALETLPIGKLAPFVMDAANLGARGVLASKGIKVPDDMRILPSVSATDPRTAPITDLTLAQAVAPLGSALNRTVNPFFGLMRRNPDNLSAIEIAARRNGEVRPRWYEVPSLGQIAGIMDEMVAADYARTLTNNQVYRDTPPEFRTLIEGARNVAISGPQSEAQAQKYLLDKQRIDSIYGEAVDAFEAGRQDVAYSKYSYAKFLEGSNTSELIHVGDNPWAEVVSGTFLDPTNLISFSWITDAIKAARMLKAAPGNIETAMKAGAEVAEKVLTGQPVVTAGYRAPDILRAVVGKGGNVPTLPIIGRTSDAMAAIDRDIVLNGFARLMQGVTSGEQAKLLLTAFLKEPAKLFTGVQALDDTLKKVGNTVKFGAQAMANKPLLDRSWLIQMVAEKLPKFKSLQDEGFNGVEFFAELDTELYRAARQRYGLTALRLEDIPYQASSHRIATLADGNYQVDFLNRAGKVVHSTAKMPQMEAQAYVKALETAMRGAQFSPIRKTLNLLTGIQREILSTQYLALRPGHWIRNAASATGVLMGENLYSLKSMDAIIGGFQSKGIGVPSARMLEGMYDRGSQVGAAADEAMGQGQNITRRITDRIGIPNPYAAVSEWGNRIWTGATEILGVPFGEQAFYVRAFDTAFGRTFTKIWKGLIDDEFTPALLDLGIAPDAARSLTNAILDAGVWGGKGDVADAVRKAVSSVVQRVSLRDFGVPDELLDPADYKGLTEILNRWVASDNPTATIDQVRTQIQAGFDVARQRAGEILRVNPQQLPVFRFTTQEMADDAANVMDEMVREAVQAGIPLQQAMAEVQPYMATVAQRHADATNKLLTEFRALGAAEQQSYVAVVFDGWAEMDKLLEEARKQVDALSDAAVKGSQTRKLSQAQKAALWQKKWADTKRIYEEMNTAQQKLLAQVRNDIADVAAGKRFEPRYNYSDRLDRYVAADERAIEEARQLNPQAATDPRQREKFQTTIAANRTYSDMAKTTLYGTFSRYPSPVALDIVAQTEKQVNELGAQAAAHLEPQRNAARAFKGSNEERGRLWDAYFAKRNETWRDWADGAVILRHNAARLIIFQGESQKLGQAVTWQTSEGARFMVEAQLGGGKWRVFNLADGGRVELPEAQVPANVRAIYERFAGRMDEESEMVLEDIQAQTIADMRNRPTTPDLGRIYNDFMGTWREDNSAISRGLAAPIGGVGDTSAIQQELIGDINRNTEGILSGLRTPQDAIVDDLVSGINRNTQRIIDDAGNVIPSPTPAQRPPAAPETTPASITPQTPTTPATAPTAPAPRQPTVNDLGDVEFMPGRDSANVPAFLAATEQQRRTVHAIGGSIYGKRWNDERPLIIRDLTDNTHSSLTTLSHEQMDELIDRLRRVEKENTPKIAPLTGLTRDEVRRQAGDVFAIEGDDLDAYMAMLDARAEVWAADTHRAAEKWYDQAFAQIRKTKTTDQMPPGAEQKVAAGTVRGATQFREDGRAIIHAFKTANLSTLLHETSHIFIEDLRRVASGSPRAASDLSLLENWAGVKGGKWDTAAHEKVAVAAEQYFREGIAPTPKLENAFARFKTWMAKIYKRVKGSLAGDMTPEVRGVFDRLFVLPEERASAIAWRNVPPAAPEAPRVEPQAPAPTTAPGAIVWRDVPPVAPEAIPSARAAPPPSAAPTPAAAAPPPAAAARPASRTKKKINSDWEAVLDVTGDTLTVSYRTTRKELKDIKLPPTFKITRDQWVATKPNPASEGVQILEDALVGAGWTDETIEAFHDALAAKGWERLPAGLGFSHDLYWTVKQIWGEPAHVARKAAPAPTAVVQYPDLGVTITKRPLPPPPTIGQVLDDLTKRVDDGDTAAVQDYAVQRYADPPVRPIEDELTAAPEEPRVEPPAPEVAAAPVQSSRERFLDYLSQTYGKPRELLARLFDYRNEESARLTRGKLTSPEPYYDSLAWRMENDPESVSADWLDEAERQVAGRNRELFSADEWEQLGIPRSDLGYPAKQVDQSAPIGSTIEAGGTPTNAVPTAQPGRVDRDNAQALGEVLPRPDVGVQEAGPARGSGARGGADDAGRVPADDQAGRGAVGSVGGDAGGVVPAPARGEGAPVAAGAGGRNPQSVSGSAKPALRDLIIDDEIARSISDFGGPKQRYRANVDAIRTLKKIREEGRHATPEEQVILARYSGWGSSKLAQELFSGRYDDPYYRRADVRATYKEYWLAEYDELKALLTDDEWRRASASTTNAHFTSPTVVRGFYLGLGRLGLGNLPAPRMLEPALGVGGFFGMMPPEIAARAMRHGVELDPITAGIASELYQNAHILTGGFEAVPLPDNYYDVVFTNAPFATTGVVDLGYLKSARKWLQAPIHNYYFAKSLDKARPGGIVAIITSRYTMDRSGPRMRGYLAEQADFLGAVRLPNNAFQKNADTSVVTDIVFLRKRRPGDPPGDQSWVKTTQYPVGGKHFTINDYYIDHPEMVLGTHSSEGSMREAHEYTVLPIEGADLGEQLAEAMGRLPANVLQPDDAVSAAVDIRGAAKKAVDASRVKQGGHVIGEGGVIKKRVGNELVDVAFTEAKQADAVRQMLELRQTAHDLLKAETTDAAAATLKELRSVLNKQYDAFTKRHGQLNAPANRALLEGDPDAYFLQGLEKPTVTQPAKKGGRATTTYSKADIFTQRVARGNAIPTNVSTASDALILALRERNSVDVRYMAGLTGKSEGEIVSELGDAIYKDPNGAYMTQDAYLSGDVRLKLQQAEEAARYDPAFQRNVDALQKVIPPDVLPSQIDAQLGAGWIPAEDYLDFIKETFRVNASDLQVAYTPAIHQWTVVAPRQSTAERLLNNSVANRSTYGTARMTGFDILATGMNNKMPVIKDEVPGSDPKQYVTNAAETEAAQEKLELLQETFRSWLWNNPERAQRLARKYNDEFNGWVSRRYDGSYLTLPGMSPNINLRSTQKDAVARILQSGNTLLAHEVGAGKTFTIATAAMEMRRLGLAKKPVIVVPNHLFEQWPSEFRQLYPMAKVLAPDEKDFTAANRARLASRIATGDWDAVIIPESQLGKLPVSIQTYEKFMNEEIATLRKFLGEVNDANVPESSFRGRRSKSSGQSPQAKQIEAAIKALENKLATKIAKMSKDNTIVWEQLGIDAIFVDEAHDFKNLMFATKMTNMSGLNPAGSDRATDLFIKTRQLSRSTGGRNVVFATGTPISNSVAEVYTLMRYLMMDTLEARGLGHFDAWAAQFGRVKRIWEETPTGQQQKLRFGYFNNAVELNHIFQQVADIIKASDVPGVKLPKLKGGARIKHTAEETPYHTSLIQSFRERAEAIKHRHGKPEKGDDILLAVYTDARKAGLDLRMISPDMPDLPNSKVNQMIAEVLRIHKQTQKELGTQFIFSNLGVPGGANFDLYNDIKAKLVRGGIPEREIAFMHDAVAGGNKQALFDKMNRGEVRVLIGSKNMETGVNAQQRAYGLHHLDGDWRPSDILQREGRIMRQGNTWDEVEIHVYLTQPLDALMWGKIEQKVAVFNTFLDRNMTTRTIEEVDEVSMDFALTASAASGDPLQRRRVEIEKAVRDINNLERAYADQQFQLRGMVAQKEQGATYWTGFAGRAKQDEATRAANSGAFRITLAGTTFTERKEVSEALSQAVLGARPQSPIIGNYRGFRLEVLFRPYGDRIEPSYLRVVGANPYDIPIASLTLNRLDREIDGISEANALSEAKAAQQAADEMRPELGKPFPRAKELADARSELNQVTTQLRRQAAPTTAADTSGTPEILYQSARPHRNINWFGLDPTDNPARALWDWTKQHWKKGRPQPGVSDVAVHTLNTLDDAERAITDALPRLAQRPPNTLTQAQRQGALAILGDNIAPRFDDTLYVAQEMAQKAADGAMLNFKDRRGLDSLLGLLFPYHFFWSRSAKNWARRVLQKPAIANIYYELERGIETENRQSGVPSRLKGTLPLYTRRDGTQVRIQNPLHYVLPFNMYFPGSVYNDPDDANTQFEKWMMSIRNYTPGIYPLWAWGMDAILDQADPLSDGSKRTSAYFTGSFTPAYQIGALGAMSLGLGGPSNQPQATGPYQDYRVGRAIPIVAMRTSANPVMAGYAQQIALNVAQNKPIYNGVPKASQKAAYELYRKAQKEAARDRIAGAGVGFLTGTNAYVLRPEEGQLTGQSRAYSQAGYNAMTNPFGSKAKQGQVLDQSPYLPGWWNKSATLPQGVQPGEPTPGQSAQVSQAYQQIDGLYARMGQRVTEYLIANPNAKPADLSKVKEPYYAQINKIQDAIGGLPQREKSVRGMTPNERALNEIEKILSFRPPNAPQYPGETATTEQKQAYYKAKALWDEARLTQIDSQLRTLMKPGTIGPGLVYPVENETWRKQLAAMLQGRYTGNLMHQDAMEYMGPIEKKWYERTSFEREYSDAQWKQRAADVTRLISPQAAAAFEQYMNTPKEQRAALADSNPIYGAAREAAYNPKEYAQGVALFGPNWYAVATGAPDYPGDNPTEAQLQPYYAALDEYKAQHPEYEAARLWYRGRPQARIANLAEGQYIPNDYGKDYAEAVNIFGGDIWQVRAQRNAAYNQSKETGYAWDDAHRPDVTRIKGYAVWYKQLGETMPAIASTTDEQVPDYSTYTGPRPVGNTLPPLGQPLPQQPAAGPLPAPTMPPASFTQAQPATPATGLPAGAAPAAGTGGALNWDMINQYAQQDAGFMQSQQSAAQWQARKAAVFAAFGQEAGNLFEQYLNTPKGAARQQFKAANPVLRAINLYTWNPDIYQAAETQFGQAAIMAWAMTPAYAETPEAKEARKAYLIANPVAWTVAAWLNGRPQADDEGDTASDDVAWKYNAGRDFAQAQQQFGPDIFTLEQQYRGADKMTRTALRNQYPQIMKFYDWWYGNLPKQQYQSAGLQRWGGGAGRGNWGRGGGGYSPSNNTYSDIPKIYAREMDKALWYGPDNPQRQWTAEGTRTDWLRAGEELSPEQLRTWRNPFPVR